MKRRKFIQRAALGGVGVSVGATILACAETKKEENTVVADVLNKKISLPVVIATWDVKGATEKAWKSLQEGKSALDAIIDGCGVEEGNAEGQELFGSEWSLCVGRIRNAILW